MWQVSTNSNRCSEGSGGACAADALVLVSEATSPPAAEPTGVHCLASAASASSPSLSDASSSRSESAAAGVLPPVAGGAGCTSR
jgi:hypothetical protein